MLTIVMYHYVRDDARVHARTVAELEAELDHVVERYTPVRLEDVVASDVARRRDACSRSTTASSSTSTSSRRRSRSAG